MVYPALVLGLLIALVALIAWGRVERHWISLAILAILLATGAVSLREAIEFIDWDVIGLILGMSILTVFLERSGLMDVVSRKLERYLNTPKEIVFWLSFLAGSISIFLENVTVVLLISPIVFRLCRNVRIHPSLVLIPVALASNMAGSATMVGDPPAIITAGYLNLAFMDFIWYRGRPSMFFLTIIPMLLACSSIALITAKLMKRYSSFADLSVEEEEKLSNVDKVFLIEAIAFLTLKIVLLSLRHTLHLSLSLIALISVGGLAMARLLHRDRESVIEAFKKGFEWKLLLFLIGVFVLSGAFAKHGLALATAQSVVSLGQRNPFIITSLLVWISVAISAFIDNVPYTTTMLPVITAIATSLNVEPITIAWAVLLGTTLGGNLTYIGASANVTAVRLLERHGYKVEFLDFIKISAPFNTISVVSGWILYEIFWIFS